MNKNEHIAVLKAMIRQTEKDLVRMRRLLGDVDGRLQTEKKKRGKQGDKN